MAPGFTVAGEMMLSEEVLGQFIWIAVGLLLLIPAAACIKAIKARPKIDVPPEPREEWIYVATPPDEKGAGEPQCNHAEYDTPPQGKETPKEQFRPPNWAHVGAAPPESFDDLINSTDESLLRRRRVQPGGGQHKRLTKKVPTHSKLGSVRQVRCRLRCRLRCRTNAR